MSNPRIAAFLDVPEGADPARMMRRSIPMGEIQTRSFQSSVNVPLTVGFRSSCVTPNDDVISTRKLDERHGFLRWMFLLVRQKHSWSPVLITGELWRCLINIGKYREVIRLFKLNPFAEIAHDNPGFALKYLVPDYLARGLTGTERVSCFLHHYRRIYAALPESVLRRILQGEVTLHEISEGTNSVTFTICLPRIDLDKEGELSLSLRVNGKKVFDLSFTIVPGWVVKSEASEILLITRLQGTRGSSSEIKIACKTTYYYPPRGALLAALQGIADAFEIGEIEAVCATKQHAYTKERSAIFINGYDHFFESAGMVKTSAGFYFSSIPIKGKPLASFKGGARPRAKKRLVMLQQIQSACAGFFLQVSDRVSGSSSWAPNSSPTKEAIESSPGSISCASQNCNLTP